MLNTTAYPLSWPLGKPRNQKRKSATFQTTFATARESLANELRLMSATSVVLSTNVELRRDGKPYSGRSPIDPGVAVYFTWREQQYAFACDCWNRVEHNLQAIRKTIEAVRGIARWGTGEMVASAFAGFKALPEQAGPSSGSVWWEVLMLGSPDVTEVSIEAAYRDLAWMRHPDRGGTQEQMAQLNEARRLGLSTVKVTK